MFTRGYFSHRKYLQLIVLDVLWHKGLFGES